MQSNWAGEALKRSHLKVVCAAHVEEALRSTIQLTGNRGRRTTKYRHDRTTELDFPFANL